MLKRWRWPSEQTRLLLSSFQSEAHPHAFLLTGPEGAGKRTLAKIYVQALLCEALPERRPCGVCGACKRVEHDSHLDVTIVRPGEDPKSKSYTITIDQARGAISSLSHTAFEGRRKALIVHQAERMQPAAQNALLKTLEEPPGDCVFFLITDKRYDLLPTVRSRCVWTPVPTLGIGLAARVLVEHGMDARQADEAARFARGAVGYALRYADEVAPIARRVRGALGGVRSIGGAPAAVKLLTSIYDEVKDPHERAARASRILETMESIVRESLERLNPEPTTDDRLNMIERIERAAPHTLLNMLDGIGDARRRLGMYISFPSIMDALIYLWLEDLYNAAGGRDQVS
ncbi:MAG: DNA polymerase III subunit delta' [Oscillospiraceae bacterium]|jgi:DNA polymerase-3 subunit delta'|nr:DNA polymerase III subunit delta' [Oscillospiraceae bacterium]